MGCASAKHVSTVQNEEEAQKGKNYQNGDVFGELRMPCCSSKAITAIEVSKEEKLHFHLSVEGMFIPSSRHKVKLPQIISVI
ncbi:prosaposin receptor GPR37L1 [Platysternon megacephalum]|uniref:Prosaposin receptor GPR37L1 n=1 Tax=Platysternon megacephalum TaxID=55544 RepID=A0A4D9DVR9_9SAUR|nr:prosaposin receptor GPR37L1 [Platysternon megacephalum]